METKRNLIKTWYSKAGAVNWNFASLKIQSFRASASASLPFFSLSLSLVIYWLDAENASIIIDLNKKQKGLFVVFVSTIIIIFLIYNNKKTFFEARKNVSFLPRGEDGEARIYPLRKRPETLCTDAGKAQRQERLYEGEKYRVTSTRGTWAPHHQREEVKWGAGGAGLKKMPTRASEQRREEAQAHLENWTNNPTFASSRRCHCLLCGFASLMWNMHNI